MRDLALDLAEYSIRAALLLYLCKDIILLKEKYRSVGKVLFFMQAFLVSFCLSHFHVLNRLLRDEENMQNISSHSILSLIVVFLCSFAAMDILYQGKRLAKIYLLSVYCTILEMVRFMLHSIWLFITNACNMRMYDRAVAGEIDVDQFAKYLGQIQFWGMLIFSLGTALCMYTVIRLYRRYQITLVTDISREGLRFLMLIPVIGTVIDITWRILFYYQKGATIEFLYDRHGSMYVVIPLVSVLCLAGIVLSSRIYAELLRSEEQKNSLLFYKQQLTDMTDHVRELERLYDGIRGMRHDINNYVADMEQLLYSESGKGQMSEQVQSEAREYLRNMQNAASALSLQFSTGNPVTDVILNRKWHICAQEKILFGGEFIYPVGLMIEAFDLGIVLNNALDNAIEACRKVRDDGRREVSFRGYEKGPVFFIVVENSYDGSAVQLKDGRIKTTKADETVHGLGMSNMKSCVEKYYGTMQFEAAGDKFTLTVMMQGKEADACSAGSGQKHGAAVL